jgi:hypothetical protein
MPRCKEPPALGRQASKSRHLQGAYFDEEAIPNVSQTNRVILTHISYENEVQSYKYKDPALSQSL